MRTDLPYSVLDCNRAGLQPAKTIRLKKHYGQDRKRQDIKDLSIVKSF